MNNQRAISTYGACSIITLFLLLFGIDANNFRFVIFQIVMFTATTVMFFVSMRAEHKRVERLKAIMGKEIG